MIIREAIDTIFTLGWALLAWVAVLAALTTAVLFGIAAAVCVTVRALWRRIRRQQRPSRDEYEEAA
ncbi:hypothetical protein AB0E99_22725 [Streptomyces sp. NPDC030592]|uniref:hypothetical protein n=1 Tax=Streptomyces sp. NPDC030592 TaxID=3155365 RepID=UPI003409A1DF